MSAPTFIGAMLLNIGVKNFIQQNDSHKLLQHPMCPKKKMGPFLDSIIDEDSKNSITSVFSYMLDWDILQNVRSLQLNK